MSDDRFRTEKMYQCSLAVAKSMRRKSLITDDEYVRIENFLIQKYHPMLGSLFAQGR